EIAAEAQRIAADPRLGVSLLGDGVEQYGLIAPMGGGNEGGLMFPQRVDQALGNMGGEGPRGCPCEDEYWDYWDYRQKMIDDEINGTGGSFSKRRCLYVQELGSRYLRCLIANGMPPDCPDVDPLPFECFQVLRRPRRRPR